MFSRSIDQDLSAWFKRPSRKPLLIRGARQVGKSTLVRRFAAGQGMDLVEVNLERHPNLNATFATFDLTKIFLELDSIAGCSIRSMKKPLLFCQSWQQGPC